MEEKERIKVLKDYGANDDQVTELLAYNKTFIRISDRDISDEPFCSIWDQYHTEAEKIGVFAVLKKYLVQISFPIREGISASPEYKDITLRGHTAPSEGGITLVQPDKLSLFLNPTVAGRIPIIYTQCREDYITLVRALAYKNEPHVIPKSLGACMVKGFNNWDRVNRYRQMWRLTHPNGDWDEEFGAFAKRKELYQDRFIILSDSGYSNVSACDIGLREDEWRRLSVVIRREHECMHYVTQRLFGSARNNAFDELIADYAGITAALGHYNAEWFLRFMGLDGYPIYRPGGRLENYKGDPPLSEGSFQILMTLVYNCARQLEQKAPTGNTVETALRLFGLSLEAIAFGEF